MKHSLRMAGLVSLSLVWSIGASGAEYEVGGPLFGVKLPPYSTQHGEEPGHPGCIPALAAAAREKNMNSTRFTSEGLPPEPQLYDGSVEHWRHYWYKYLPVRSFFDRQSLIRNWPAKDIPGVKKEQVEDYAEPVYWVPRYEPVVNTGATNKPVPVVRCKPRSPVLELDLGKLDAGLYAVRVIAAVETKQIEPHRKPIYLRMTVNDGLKGEESTYRIRIGYVDEFYSVAEIYFHAPEPRAYKAKLCVDEGSLADLLVHNVDLHDVLAGAEDRAIKTRITAQKPPEKPTATVTNDAARLARDEMLWNSLTPINAQAGSALGMGGNPLENTAARLGAGGKSEDEIAKLYGTWQEKEATGDVLLVNTQLNLKYTISDLKAGRPLPDPYPFKDSGAGVYTPSEKPGEPGQNLYPVANGVWFAWGGRVPAYFQKLNERSLAYQAQGDEQAGRDAAIMFCRFAYDFAALDDANAMTSILVQPGAYGRDLRCRRRNSQVCADPDLLHTMEVLWTYDRLFNAIQGNESLAASVGRFVPWVKTPRDVVRLIDVYYVQMMAKRLLRYHNYNDNAPGMILTPVLVLGDTRATDPWMEWLFSKTFVYPLPPAGLQDLLVAGNDRDGIGYIGSYMYVGGENVLPVTERLEQYIELGGKPKYDLRDQKRYPKAVSACRFFLESRLAGLHFPRIGDVTGPDKYYAAGFPGEAWCRMGWKWTRDPRFAFVIKHYMKRGNETDAEWAAIEKSAAELTRAPWLDYRSRVLINWCGILESGREHDDFRFRRAAMVRVGQGNGHAHCDTLDLLLYAHGLPMTVDGGQRPGYSQPRDQSTRIHNVVEVDGKDWMGHAWVTALSDGEGARYLAAEAVPPKNHPDVRLFKRQVALVDVDEGKGSRRLTPEQCGPSSTNVPKDIVTPSSYVWDVFRVSGGKQHTYCFHATVNDTNGPQPQTSLKAVTPIPAQAPTDDTPAGRAAAYVGNLSNERYWATAPSDMEVVFHLQKQRATPGNTEREAGTEQWLMQSFYDPASPDKFTRWHVLGAEGALVMKGDQHCRQWQYFIPNFFVQRTGTDLESVFTAVIEPYAGEPFITGRRSLDVAENETDARRAVAVEVKTQNGHTDVLFADGRPERERVVQSSGVKLQVSGEFACYSRDAEGLRLASLTGGTLLSTPDIRLKTAQRERLGKVTAADYLEKAMTIDPAWPQAALNGRVFEVGMPGHPTTYTIESVSGNGSVIKVTEGAQFYLSRVQEVDSASNRVVCGLGLSQNDKAPCPGIDRHWVASNEEKTKFWRAEYLGKAEGVNGYAFKLEGGPVKREDFGRTQGFALWEYGVGDTVRQSTFVNLRRLSNNEYELTGDVDVEVTFKGGKPRKVTAAELAAGNGAIKITTAK